MILWDDDQIDAIVAELTDYHLYTTEKTGADGYVSADIWWASITDCIDDDGAVRFPLLGYIALALCTSYNSSGPTERDFSIQSHIHGNNRLGSMGQKKLVSKMTVRSCTYVAARDCQKCNEAIEAKEELRRKGNKPAPFQSTHCHCSLMPVTDEETRHMSKQDRNRNLSQW